MFNESIRGQGGVKILSRRSAVEAHANKLIDPFTIGDPKSVSGDRSFREGDITALKRVAAILGVIDRRIMITDMRHELEVTMKKLAGYQKEVDSGVRPVKHMAMLLAVNGYLEQYIPSEGGPEYEKHVLKARNPSSRELAEICFKRARTYWLAGDNYAGDLYQGDSLTREGLRDFGQLWLKRATSFAMLVKEPLKINT